MIIVCAIFEIECPHQNIKKANFIHSCNRLFKLNLAHKTPAQAKTSDTELMGAATDIRTHSSSRKIKHFLVVAHSTLHTPHSATPVCILLDIEKCSLQGRENA